MNAYMGKRELLEGRGPEGQHLVQTKELQLELCKGWTGLAAWELRGGAGASICSGIPYKQSEEDERHQYGMGHLPYKDKMKDHSAFVKQNRVIMFVVHYKEN